MRFPDGQEKSVPRNRLLPLPTRPPRQCDWAMAIDSWVYSAWHPGPKQTSKVECYEVSYFFRDSSTASRWCHGDTVDGRNPAPVHRWFIPLFTGFFYIPGGAGFLPSTVSFRDAVFDFQLMSSHGSWYWLTSSGFERGTRTLQRLSLHLRPSCSAGTSASKIPRNWSVVVAGGFEKLHASLFAVHWFRLFHYIPWCFDTKLCIIQCL